MRRLRESRARVVVTGLAVTYPLGGSFWDYIQYVVGFRRLGHEVLYLEDTGQWCYDPWNLTYTEDGARNARHFQRNLERLDPEIEHAWFYRDLHKTEFGMPWKEVVEFCRRADLFLHLSATCLLCDEYLAAATVAFIDSDPMYTQWRLLHGLTEAEAEERVRWWRDRHDVFFSFGERIGNPDCAIPTGPILWQATRQPVVMDLFAPHARPVDRRRDVFTTVASWEPKEDGPVVDGVAYRGKSTEFLRFLDLPQHCRVPIELALSGGAPETRLREAGFLVRHAAPVSSDPWVYCDYLADSMGEWSVAKNAYVQSRSGWFSCRTACYLALGVPAVVQDTGFPEIMPVGRGVIAFKDTAEAAAAVNEIAADPVSHSEAAKQFAADHLAHDKVLPDLLDRALARDSRREGVSS